MKLKTTTQDARLDRKILKEMKQNDEKKRRKLQKKNNEH